MTAPRLYMAPLKGITDALFRRVYNRHFPGLDGALAPFVNPQQSGVYSDKVLADLLPENQCDLPLEPQILSNDADGFVSLAGRLHDLGYREVNWNLGCPVPMVARKARGSGLLPDPDRILALLDDVLSRIRPRLSIKMRLGLRDAAESRTLLPGLEPYPLSRLVIHPRLGIQLYRGTVSLEDFARCCELTSHPVVYNGDLRSRDDYLGLSARFPGVSGWMIGRGLLADPFLPAEIKGARYDAAERRRRLAAFHGDLYDSLSQRLSGPGHLLGRLKQVWIYFIGAFPGQQKQLKRITRAGGLRAYHEAVRRIMDEADHARHR